MVSSKRQSLTRIYDAFFRLCNYDWVLHRLSGLPFIQNNPRWRDRILAEATFCRARYGKKDRPAQVTLSNGLKMNILEKDDFVQKNLYFARGYSLEEQDILARHLDPGDIFIDVGANIGVFALMAAQQVGSNGVVFAFEPATDTMQQLKDNAALNNMENIVQFMQYALSDENGTMSIYDSETQQEDVGKRSLFQSGREVESVATRVFDDMVTSGEITIDRPIGGIKIDVEGAELLVLKGMRETIINHKPKVILSERWEENLDRAGISQSQIDAFLEDCGYRALPGNAGNGRTDEPVMNIAYVPV